MNAANNPLLSSLENYISDKMYHITQSMQETYPIVRQYLQEQN